MKGPTAAQLQHIGQLALEAELARRTRKAAKQVRNDAAREAYDNGYARDSDPFLEATASEQALYRSATRKSQGATQRLRRAIEAIRGTFEERLHPGATC